MRTTRLEAFSDAVIAIAITVMVLELKAPEGASLAALKPVLPALLTYLLSFIYLGIYWNNHHHLFHLTEHVTGGIMWANMHLLFWLSLVPFTTGWMGENHFATVPTAVYGVSLLLPAIAYYVLQQTIIAAQGPGSKLRAALGTDIKGKLSPILYLTAIGLSFVRPWMADAIYVFVALIWLVPDRRIEARLAAEADTDGD